MRKIAIVGSGQAGLQLAFGLLRNGYAVTLYSDRTPEEVLNSRVPATAFIFDRGLSYERELGLNFWDEEVKWGEGIHLDFCLAPDNRLFHMTGRWRRQKSRWIPSPHFTSSSQKFSPSSRSWDRPRSKINAVAGTRPFRTSSGARSE